MDIHRSRFVQYPASPINALAFTRSNDKNLTDPRPALKLALGRENGDIEIWDVEKGTWVQEACFPGNHGKSVDQLVWIQEPDDTDHEGRTILGQLRLFSSGSTAAITEWDLATGLPLRASTGNFTQVWAFAAQPRWKPSKSAALGENEYKGQDLVVGCGDGTIAILSTADNDLVFKRFLARSGSRKASALSLAWQSRDIVIAGCADSTIRVYDVRNGNLLRAMSLGAGIPGMPRDTLIWKVKCLPNGDIVSADSNGEVRIWDGRTYSLSQRLTGHDTDCLELVTSTDGRTIVSAGMDGKLAFYKIGADNKKFAKTTHRRMHQGDIKALAVYDAKHASVVVSGGFDTVPVVTPLRNYNKENHRRLPGLPQAPACVSAPGARLFVSWWQTEISIWRIYKQYDEGISPTAGETRKLVAHMQIEGDEYISSVAISDDGSLLTASTLHSVKVWQLHQVQGTHEDRLRVRKISLPSGIATMGARLVNLSPNAQWLSVVSPDSEIHVARFNQSSFESGRIELLEASVELERQTRKVTKQTGLRKYERNITRVAFSPDGAVLVAGDLSGFLDSWVLEGHFDSTSAAVVTAKEVPSAGSSNNSASSDSDSDSDDDDEITIFYGQHWADNRSGTLLPKLDSAPLVLSFRPSPSQSRDVTNGNPGVHATRNNPNAHSHELPSCKSPLFVVTAQHQVYEFDILAGRLTDWSRKNPTSVLPAEFRTIKDRIMGVVWDVDSQRARAWLYGSNWVGMLDLSQTFNLPSVHDDTNAIEDADDDDVDAEDAEADAQTPNKKRKRRESGKWGRIADARKRAKGASGAGDKVAHGENKGLPEEIRRIEDGKVVEERQGGARAHARLDLDDDDDDAMDDDYDNDNDGAVGPLRRDGDMDVHATTNNNSDGAVVKRSARRKWWCTYKYRPILGMVPIGGRRHGGGGGGDDDDDADDAEENWPLEAVLIERPLWELPHVRDLGKQK